MQAHQNSFTDPSSPPQKRLSCFGGHQRRPSIGKSMPVTAILLNFPQTVGRNHLKNFSTLSRDGISPDSENPSSFFNLNEANNEISYEESSVKKPSTIDDRCAKLCNNECKTSNQLEDVEDTGRKVCINTRSTQSNTKTPFKYLEIPDSGSKKLNEQRKSFLNDMLNDENFEYSRINSNDSDNGNNSYDSSTSDRMNNEATTFDIKDFREKFAIAEALAKTSMMTSPAAKRRLKARKIEMEINCGCDGGNIGSVDVVDRVDYQAGGNDIAGGAISAACDEENDFVPPRQLLLYLVRMGSFNSAPKIHNSDSQDDSLEIPKGLTPNDLVQHCKIMRGENRPQLLTRFFLKPITKDTIFSSGITEGLRVLKLNEVSKVCSAPATVTSPKHLRILQWNILSQSLGQNNDGFICCPDEALTWENRKYLIIEEIIKNNPDVVCLQEVDHFKFLERILATQDYEGIFFPKPDSPCLYIQENNGPDGCAIFYKREKFDLLKFDTRILEVWRVQSNQVAIAAALKIKETGKEICVCTTHLKARNGALLSKLRNEQGKDLLRFLTNFAEDRPVLLCGDFNAEPIEPIYGTVLNHKGIKLSSAYSDIIAAEEIEKNKQSDDQNRINIKDEACEQKSPIEISAGCEPPYTTWKIREEGEVCHTIDYVFYSKNHMMVKNCLLFPEEDEIGEHRTPSFQYPSDHFSLVCDFELLDPFEE